MKISDVKITENQVEVVLAGTDGPALRYEGFVQHSLTMDRDGKLGLFIEVTPRRPDPALRPSVPPRNAR